jgi:hypothetical protein
MDMYVSVMLLVPPVLDYAVHTCFVIEILEM